MEYVNAKEKIEIIKSKINSIKDFVDVLRRDCLFGGEFIDLFRSLSEVELAILCKIVFNEECRVETLGLHEVIFDDASRDYEWEGYFVEFLRSLDDEIRGIGKKINQI